jgi:hypothetical protein
MFYIWTGDAGVALGKACDTKSKWGTQWETASWASGMGLLIYIYIISFRKYLTHLLEMVHLSRNIMESREVRGGG